MSNNKHISNTKTISQKKSNELYRVVDKTIMDARIDIKKYIDTHNLSKHHDKIDKILFDCGINAAQGAIDVFKKTNNGNN